MRGVLGFDLRQHDDAAKKIGSGSHHKDSNPKYEFRSRFRISKNETPRQPRSWFEDFIIGIYAFIL